MEASDQVHIAGEPTKLPGRRFLLGLSTMLWLLINGYCYILLHLFLSDSLTLFEPGSMHDEYILMTKNISIDSVSINFVALQKVWSLMSSTVDL